MIDAIFKYLQIFICLLCKKLQPVAHFMCKPVATRENLTKLKHYGKTQNSNILS
jgi:hypothetical protein